MEQVRLKSGAIIREPGQSRAEKIHSSTQGTLVSQAAA